MSIDPQKFENPNTYINYLANYENSIKFLEVFKLNFRVLYQDYKNLVKVSFKKKNKLKKKFKF